MMDNDDFAAHLESYKILIDYEKWAYDTYLRDYRFFATLEGILIGITLKSIWDIPKETVPERIVLLGILIAVGVFVTVVWASRQWRAGYHTKARFVELARLEQKLDPNCFRFFHKIQPEANMLIRDDKGLMPLMGTHLKIVPNLLRKKAFLRTLIVQQVILFLWLGIGIVLILKFTNWAGLSL